MRTLFTIFLGLLFLIPYSILIAGKGSEHVHKQVLDMCQFEVALHAKEIETELMYRCNNNYCVNYGRNHYLFQCYMNKMEK